VLFGLLIVLMVMMRAKSQKTALMEREKMYLSQLESQSSELTSLGDKLSEATQQQVRSDTENIAVQKQMEEFKNNSKELELKFENLANKIFDEKTTKFKSDSQESIGAMLSPLREKLKDFEKKVDDSFSTQKAEQFSLKEQIQLFVQSSDQMKTQTENLTNALKGDNKAQGAWGEIILEKILESAGLKKDINYSIQATGLGLKHAETGAHLKPDVIVNLPEDKHIIIDSKVSLTAYERFCSSDDESARNIELKKFLLSVKEKVKELESRRYQDTDQLGTPDFVVMFMPVEGAYMLALQSDQNLHQFAWDKGVVLAGPATLYSTLRTVASLWMMVNQNNNSKEIVQHGNALYDKVVGFVEDMKKIGANLKTVETNYDKAMVKLSGKGSILNRTENMKSLGLTTSKSIPNDMLENQKAVNKINTDEAA
jgi:DNA recombination protein RmuC